MVQLPRSLSLRQEDELPTVIGSLLAFARDVIASLRAQPAVQIKEFSMLGADSDFVVALDFTPQSVSLARVVDEDGAPVGAVHTLSWDPDPSGFVVRAVDGLTGGTRYVVRVIATRGGA